MSTKAIYRLIIDKLKEGILTAQIEEDDLNSIMNEPDGKIVVMYNSGTVSPTKVIFHVNENDSFLINILFRDPLKSADVLDLIDSVKMILHGLKIQPNDIERLRYNSTQFQEFIPETSIYAYVMMFSVEQTKTFDNNE